MTPTEIAEERFAEIRDAHATLDPTSDEARGLLTEALQIRQKIEKTRRAGEFPSEILHGGLLGEYLEAVGPVTQAPDSYHVLNFLTVAGLTLGRNIWVQTPEPIYPNLYGLLIGQTATTKKTTAVRLARRLLRDVAPEVVTLPGVVSTESVYDVLAVQPRTRALIVFDEFRALFSIGKRQSTGDLIPKLGSLYYCPDYDAINRREPGKETKRTTEIHEPFLSMIGNSPSGWLEGEITSGHIAGGFVNRICTVYGEGKSAIPFPPPVDQGRWSRLAASLKEVAAYWAQNPGAIGWNADAKGMYERYYKQTDAARRKQDDRTTEITGRVDEHTLKIGVILSGLERSRTMTRDALSRAILFGSYLEGAALHIFGNITASAVGRVETKIIERLRGYGGRVKKRQLQNSLNGGCRDAGEFNRAWWNLNEGGRVRQETPDGSREVWAVLV
ncbi:MAG: DUF3987 domain-containing protein [Nitrospirae bacterium]|nr:DUF3987 domain-containing protein [Nitrospirota bacterium]